MKLWKFVWIALMAGLLVVFACSEEETPTDPGPGDPDPNVFCNEEACANNEALKQECIDRFTLCVANEEGSEEECIVIAVAVCNI
ncbi:hypothetical protein ACFLSH_04060 [Bacteroidota bacterium]